MGAKAKCRQRRERINERKRRKRKNDNNGKWDVKFKVLTLSAQTDPGSHGSVQRQHLL
jgi:hypothetical protein